MTTAGARTIAAWGGHGRIGGRSTQVGPLLNSPLCLGVTQLGEPRHPLYVADETPLVPWVTASSAPHPEDEKLKTVLLRATPAARERLRTALEAMKSRTAADPRLVTWSSMTGTGTAADPLVLSYPSYDETIEELLAALRGVNAQPVFDWMSWKGSRRYPRGKGLAEAPVADAMRLITTIERGEHFCDGTIARAVEDGSLVTAAERINAALDQPALPN